MGKSIIVVVLLLLASAIMAVAWLGHLRFLRWGFWAALAGSWALVLPEYVLNVAATRYGFGTFSGAQMAAIHLSGGVVCVVLVSRFVLGETLSLLQMGGFGMLAVSMGLIMGGR